jgi:hypothetical protein
MLHGGPDPESLKPDDDTTMPRSPRLKTTSQGGDHGVNLSAICRE